MAIKASVYNQKAEKTGEIELMSNVFGKEVNESLVHQVMVIQSGNARQVLAHTKTRAEVSGGGRKPWRQKGTGRARAGSSRSPIWIGGGVTFGPRNERNFKKNINKKMKQGAICMALSDRLSSNALAVLEELKIDEYKTKQVDELIGAMEEKAFGKSDKKAKRSILIVNDEADQKVYKSSKNLEGVKVINLNNINLIDLLKYKNLLLTKKGIKKIEEQYGK
jgi:large subunit ribosomal protein L4